MITCRELIDLLLDFVGDELDLTSREKVEQHLQDCIPCLVLVETYKITIQLSRKLPCDPLPSELAQRLWAVVEQQQNSSGNQNQAIS